MQIFDTAATQAALPLGGLIDTLRRRFTETCEVPQRHVHEITSPPLPGQEDLASRRMTSLIMPAWTAGRHYGVKIVNIAPGNARRNLPSLHGSYLLFDARTGVPLACMDGEQITTLRTVAASALAASYLARPEASHLLVVGAGRLAQWLPQAHRAVRPIERVTVWARRPEAAQALAEAFCAQGFDAQATHGLRAACAEADIVSCATSSTEPLVHGDWLLPGSHLDLMGSFTPTMREADDASFANARVFVDTEEAMHKSGDLISPITHGVLLADEVRGTLTTLCKGVATGRMSAPERTVFKSVGSAQEDLAAAVMVWESN